MLSLRADWGSLSGWTVPEWYKDAKFGIFIHWGVYSVPTFDSVWYPWMMYTEASPDYRHQVATYGPVTKFGYKDFIPMFKAERHDPAAWARLFKQSIAKYVVPVFEHHDGFQMYDSASSDWNAVKMGPHRDRVDDLAKAVRSEGLHLGASSHRIEHDWFMEGGRRFVSDVNDPEYAAFYRPAQMQVVDRVDKDGSNLSQDWTYVSPAYGEDWLARSAEIVQKYYPDFFFVDWGIGQLSVRAYMIYGTRPWKIYGEGPTKVADGSFHDAYTKRFTGEDYPFTTKGNPSLRHRDRFAGERSGGDPFFWHWLFDHGAIQSVTLFGSTGALKSQQSGRLSPSPCPRGRLLSRPTSIRLSGSSGGPPAPQPTTRAGNQ